jgi:hypothetical protein
MRGEDRQQTQLFSYVSPERRVLAEHPLRPIRVMALERLSPRLAALYSHTGHPLELLPEEVARRLPPLYSQEEIGSEALVQVKFFTPLVELDLVRLGVRSRPPPLLRSRGRPGPRVRQLLPGRARVHPRSRRPSR